jgi:hypothetical protein
MVQQNTSEFFFLKKVVFVSMSDLKIGITHDCRRWQKVIVEYVIVLLFSPLQLQLSSFLNQKFEESKGSCHGHYQIDRKAGDIFPECLTIKTKPTQNDRARYLDICDGLVYQGYILEFVYDQCFVSVIEKTKVL